MRAHHRARTGGARRRAAVVVLPLALVAGAWTASMGAGSTTSAALDASSGPDLPAVPATPLEQPASYTRSPAVTTAADSPNLSEADPARMSVSGIPSAALAAYRRAEAVLDQADPACHLSWALVAAIGRVESDHGRFGGSVLGADGRARPAIHGLALDGSGGTLAIADTDGGRLDGDATWDRAVGPMQFIPSTWAVVGVDGDADGVRDPQDIDDAAIAAAVYLCAGDLDLATAAGQRAAVLTYNHSDEYADLVLAIMAGYLDGEFTEVPDGLPAPAYQPPATADEQPRRVQRGSDRRDRDGRDAGRDLGSTTAADDGGTPSGTGQAGDRDGGERPERPHDSTPPSDGPTDDEPSTSGPVDQVAGTANGTADEVEANVSEPADAVVETLSLSEATAKCRARLEGSLLVTDTMIEACGRAVAGSTEEEASALLSGSVAEIIARLGL